LDLSVADGKSIIAAFKSTDNKFVLSAFDETFEAIMQMGSEAKTKAEARSVLYSNMKNLDEASQKQLVALLNKEYKSHQTSAMSTARADGQDSLVNAVFTRPGSGMQAYLMGTLSSEDAKQMGKLKQLQLENWGLYNQKMRSWWSENPDADGLQIWAQSQVYINEYRLKSDKAADAAGIVKETRERLYNEAMKVIANRTKQQQAEEAKKAGITPPNQNKTFMVNPKDGRGWWINDADVNDALDDDWLMGDPNILGEL
jgi:hypothetical protein